MPHGLNEETALSLSRSPAHKMKMRLALRETGAPVLALLQAYPHLSAALCPR